MTQLNPWKFGAVMAFVYVLGAIYALAHNWFKPEVKRT